MRFFLKIARKYGGNVPARTPKGWSRNSFEAVFCMGYDFIMGYASSFQSVFEYFNFKGVDFVCSNWNRSVLGFLLTTKN